MGLESIDTHTLPKCKREYSCQKNFRLLTNMLRAIGKRLNEDFTLKYEDLAIRNVPHRDPSRWKTYRDSWNGHRDIYKNTLKSAKKCMSTLAGQIRAKKCGCDNDGNRFNELSNDWSLLNEMTPRHINFISELHLEDYFTAPSPSTGSGTGILPTTPIPFFP